MWGPHASGLAFACDLRLIDDLDDLLASAAARGTPLTYQAHLAPRHASPAELRDVKINALRIRSTRGMPALVAARQERLAHELESAAALVE